MSKQALSKDRNDSAVGQLTQYGTVQKKFKSKRFSKCKKCSKFIKDRILQKENTQKAVDLKAKRGITRRMDRFLKR